MASRWLVGAVAAAVSLAAACGAEEEGPPETAEAPCDGRGDTYTAGIEKTGAGGLVRVSILDAQPAPPAKGTNVLRIRLADAAGSPIAPPTIGLTPRMPDHGHGSAVTPKFTPTGTTGEYDVTDLYLAMPGLWELVFDIATTEGATDTVTFAFCIEG